MTKRLATICLSLLGFFGMMTHPASATILPSEGDSGPTPAPKKPDTVSAPQHNWDGVAACESSGDWNIDSGNGYYGGLQFTLSTWRAFGGYGLPNLATKVTQIRIAERVLKVQGIGAWPVCGRYLTAATG